MKPLEDSLAAQFNRLPPHSVEAEMCLLASLIIDPKFLTLLRSSLGNDQFFQQDHATVYEVLTAMADAGIKIDALTLREELHRRHQLEDIGGIPYLAEIVNAVPTAANASEYARIVRERWVLRGLIQIGNEIIRRTYAPAVKDEGPEIIQHAMTELVKLATCGRAGDAFTTFGDILDATLAHMTAGGVPCVPTGFPSVDAAMGGGLALGEMWLVGARPSMGKSTWVRQVAIRAAKANFPVAFVSLEEGKFKIARNILSAETRIDNNRLRKSDQLRDGEWQMVRDAADCLKCVPLYVSENTRRMTDIRAELTAMVARYGIKLVIVDYLQRIHADGNGEYERASEASKGMSDLIKELNVAGLVPVQLSRKLEHRDDKRPNMSDIRDSGKIEQDADGIIFLHREDYYRVTDPSRKNEPLDGIAELIFAKYRDGIRGGTVQLQSRLHYQTFDDRVESATDISSRELAELGI